MRISDWSSDVCSSDLDARIVRAAKTIDRLIEAGPVRLADAARESDLSLGRFRHLFTAEIGLPFQRYVLWRRLLIGFDSNGGQHSATGEAHMAGFSDRAHFPPTNKASYCISATARNVQEHTPRSPPA